MSFHVRSNISEFVKVFYLTHIFEYILRKNYKERKLIL